MDDSEEEFVDEEEAEGGGMAALKRLREKLAKAVQEKQEYLEGWQRSRADFANYKREESLMHADREERIKSDLVESLLPALDALELALRHEETPTLKMLEKQFVESLRKIGVQRFGTVGEAFNPHTHEALAQKGDEHKVESVERSGYSIGEKIIRPAQVII
ncbi:MAG: GrpE protein [Candidatus Adlerbacteria bacterium]|nr:GrpE protein [Candidatus Adlerbacteria bacterium]